MGYDPEFFGPPSWHILHTLAAHIIILQSKGIQPKPYIGYFKNIAESMKKLTPCEKCRKNYIINCRVIKINNYCDSALNIFLWTIDLHNLVNAETNKKSYAPELALKAYHLNPLNQKYWCDPKNFEDSMWKMIHCLAGNLVMKQEEKKQDITQEKIAYKKFIDNLALLIPCNDFRNHFQKSLKIFPLKTNTRKARDLFDWSVKIHNYMNKQFGKDQTRLEQAYKFYGLLPEN